MQVVNGYIDGNTVVMVDEIPQTFENEFIVHVVMKENKYISKDQQIDTVKKANGSWHGLWGENVDDYIKSMREDRIF